MFHLLTQFCFKRVVNDPVEQGVTSPQPKLFDDISDQIRSSFDQDKWLLNDLNITPHSRSYVLLEAATGVLVSGCHGGGKTTRAARLSEFYSRRGRKVIVLPDVEFMRSGGFWTLYPEAGQNKAKRDNFERHVTKLKKKDPSAVIIFVHSAQTHRSRVPFVEWFQELGREQVVELRGETDPFLATLLGLECCSVYTMAMALSGIVNTQKFLKRISEATPVGNMVMTFCIPCDSELAVARLGSLRRARKRQFDAFWQLVHDKPFWNTLKF